MLTQLQRCGATSCAARYLPWLILLILSDDVRADVKMPALFSNHAVVQRDQKVPVWGWAGDHTSDFWARRQAHETSVHRIDAQLAAGAVLSIAPPELAADGIDEWFDVLVAATGIAARVTGTGETLHLHAIDTEGEWLFTRTPDGLGLERSHAKGDAAVRGPASDLFLLLMNRRSLDHADGFGELEVFGDPAVVDNLRHDAAL